MKLTQVSFTLLTFCLAFVSGTKAVEAASLSVVADGLDNARGLGFGPDGSLYVTESGLGGDGACVSSPSVQNQPLCSGNTGAVTRVKDGKQERVITGLPSLARSPSQVEGAGPQDIKFDGFGTAYLLIGFAGNPSTRDTDLNAAGGNLNSPDALLNSPGLGKLYKGDINTGSWTSIADFAAYELANDPDGGAGTLDPNGALITNPYALAIKGNTAYVADAGGNSLYTLGLDGSNLQGDGLPTQIIDNPVFPAPVPGQPLPPGAPTDGQPPEQLELQSVPTGVAIGPDGLAYYSEFTGYPYPEGEARILRIGRDGEAEVFAEGFTQIGDLEFDGKGNLNVLQYADESAWKGKLEGSLIQLAPDGTRTTLISAGEGLVSATAIDVGPNGDIYVTNKGDLPGEGQVLQVSNVEEVPEPSSMLGLLAFGALGGGAWLKRKRKQQASTRRHK